MAAVSVKRSIDRVLFRKEHILRRVHPNKWADTFYKLSMWWSSSRYKYTASSVFLGNCKSISSIMSSAKRTNKEEQPRGWCRVPQRFSATSKSLSSAAILSCVVFDSPGRKNRTSGLPAGVSQFDGLILCKFQCCDTLCYSSWIKLMKQNLLKTLNVDDIAIVKVP